MLPLLNRTVEFMETLQNRATYRDFLETLHVPEDVLDSLWNDPLYLTLAATALLIIVLVTSVWCFFCLRGLCQANHMDVSVRAKRSGLVIAILVTCASLLAYQPFSESRISFTNLTRASPPHAQPAKHQAVLTPSRLTLDVADETLLVELPPQVTCGESVALALQMDEENEANEELPTILGGSCPHGNTSYILHEVCLHCKGPAVPTPPGLHVPTDRSTSFSAP